MPEPRTPSRGEPSAQNDAARIGRSALLASRPDIRTSSFEQRGVVVPEGFREKRFQRGRDVPQDLALRGIGKPQVVQAIVLVLFAVDPLEEH